MDKNEIFALELIRNVGPTTVSKIIDYMEKQSIDSIRDIDVNDLIINIRQTKTKEALLENLPWENFQRYINDAKEKIFDIEEKGISIVCINDTNYPKLLKMIKTAPVFLYCRGDLALLEKTNNVAVVGTRNNTEHGKLIAEKTIEFLCENDYTIVSGLALGIDTIAHQKTLDQGGKTISVLVDVDNVQPASNRDLANDILEQGGLLVAEEKPGTKTIPSMFAKRDRIQSGMSLAVFPIETSINGGTMHAVKSATKENRFVYVPDAAKSGYVDIGIEQIEGIKYLIEEEIAIPYTKKIYGDILESLHKKEKELMFHPKEENSQVSNDKGLFG